MHKDLLNKLREEIEKEEIYKSAKPHNLYDLLVNFTGNYIIMYDIH